jgi:hypothetical protein
MFPAENGVSFNIGRVYDLDSSHGDCECKTHYYSSLLISCCVFLICKEVS